VTQPHTVADDHFDRRHQLGTNDPHEFTGRFSVEARAYSVLRTCMISSARRDLREIPDERGRQPCQVAG
jgi:hypothetical protein